MARITVTVCDICEDPTRAVRTYPVRCVEDGRAKEHIRCEEHGVELEALLPPHGEAAKPEPRARKKAPAKKTARRSRSLTAEQVAELEK